MTLYLFATNSINSDLRTLSFCSFGVRGLILHQVHDEIPIEQQLSSEWTTSARERRRLPKGQRGSRRTRIQLLKELELEKELARRRTLAAGTVVVSPLLLLLRSARTSKSEMSLLLQLLLLRQQTVTLLLLSPRQTRSAGSCRASLPRSPCRMGRPSPSSRR